MAEQRFIDNGDGTVTDTWTKLMWMQEDSFLMTKKFLIYLHAQRLRDKLTQNLLLVIPIGVFLQSVRRIACLIS